MHVPLYTERIISGKILLNSNIGAILREKKHTDI